MMLLFKISLVIFMAGNLLEMGLRLNPPDAVRGLKNVPFVLHVLFWGFVVGPAVAYGITLALPLDYPYAIGLILIGMTPCAPFVPLFVIRVKGDLGYTAAFMLLTAIGTIIVMPFAVPLLATGLTVTAWAIAKPLIIIILIPLLIGMGILHYSKVTAEKMAPMVKKVTMVFTVATFILIIIIYGKGILSVAGSLAVASQVILFSILTLLPFWLGFGLKYEEKIVMSIGMSTRNLGAALAPLLSVAMIDQRATVMVALALPIMVLFAMLSVRIFGRRVRRAHIGSKNKAVISDT